MLKEFARRRRLRVRARRRCSPRSPRPARCSTRWSASRSARSSTRSPAPVVGARPALRAGRVDGVHRDQRRRLGHRRGSRAPTSSCRWSTRPSSARSSPASQHAFVGIFAARHRDRRAGADRARDHRRGLRRRLARRAAAQRLRRRLPREGRRRPRRSSAPRCRSSPAGSTTSCSARVAAGTARAAGGVATWPAATRPRRQHPRSAKRRARRARSPSSTDLNGAVILLAVAARAVGLGPAMIDRMEESMRPSLDLVATPTSSAARASARSSRPRSAARAARPAPPIRRVRVDRRRASTSSRSAFSPRPGAQARRSRSSTRSSGFKNLFGMRAVFETGKNLAKVGVVGAIAALAVFPKLDELAALVGMPPAQLLPMLATEVLHVAQRAARRLPVHRVRRLRLAALPPREVAEDGQAGGQGRVQGPDAPAGDRAAQRRRAPRARQRRA